MVVGQFAVTLEVAFSHPCKYFNTQVYSIYYMLASSYFLGWMTNISLWRWRRVVEQLPPDCCDNNSSEFEIWHFIRFDSLHCIYFFKKLFKFIWIVYALHLPGGYDFTIYSSTASNECVTKFHSTGCKCAAKNVLCTINLPRETDREYDRGTVDWEVFFVCLFFKVKPQKVDTWRKVK